MNQQRQRFIYIASIAGLMLLAAVLRWIDIGTESLWVDEIYSYRQAIKPLANIIANAPSDVHPPVYYILLHWWVMLFGTSEAGLRGLSVFFAVLSIPLFFALGKRLWSPRVGVFAAFLLTISHFHIHYAQEARSYSYVVFVTILGMLAFMRLLDEVRSRVVSASSLSWQTILFYIGANVLLMYSHFFALFVIVAQNIFIASLVLFEKQTFARFWKQWFALQVALLVIFTPWLNILYWQIRVVKGGFWIDKPTVFSLVETMIEYAGSLSAAALVLPLCILGCLEIRKRIVAETTVHTLRASRLDYIWLLGLWLLLPILIPFLQSLVGTPIYYVKYTIPALPAFLLLAAKGMDAWETDAWRGKSVLAAVVFVLSVVAWYNIRNDWYSLEKETWREAASYLHSSPEQTDVVFVHDWYCAHNLTYYLQRSNTSNRLALQPLPPERLRFTPEMWQRLYFSQIAGKDRLRLVLSHRTAKTQQLLDTIHNDFVCTSDSVFPSRYRKYMVSDSFPFQTRGVFLMKTYLSNDIRVMHFRRKSAP
jgi:uncharacterized membrane protein